ncbi:hypothetical protein [Mycolicibacterium conceptionense]|uniref:hypothetical protein n=1 Tax=Mycolicibacterium conceptionense TaxID=451644 RepID=UPI000B011040|nr:hypothetical protein [Mycolicibacterium conceptionense]
MSDGYWVVSVDRDTGEATTSDWIDDKDKAWEEATRLERPNIFTTVVPRRHGAARRDQP